MLMWTSVLFWSMKDFEMPDYIHLPEKYDKCNIVLCTEKIEEFVPNADWLAIEHKHTIRLKRSRTHN